MEEQKLTEHPADQATSQVVHKATMSAQYSGPLPLPSHLREYDDIVPGAAERILSMVERQSQHRQELEKIVVKGDTRRSWAGLVFGGFLAICCVGGGVALCFFGQSVAGATIATASVVGLAGVFVYGPHSRRAEREEKQDVIRQSKAPRKG